MSETHTPGALRAVLAVASQMGRGKSDEELADIISRETGDLRMLEALEWALKHVSKHGTELYEDNLAKAQAAIRKAREGSHA